MSDIPPISSSAITALQRGFNSLDRGVAEIVDAGNQDPSQEVMGDSVDIRSGGIMETEPMLAGVRDLMLARMQVGAGAVLLHAYNRSRQDLFDMLKK